MSAHGTRTGVINGSDYKRIVVVDEPAKHDNSSALRLIVVAGLAFVGLLAVGSLLLSSL